MGKYSCVTPPIMCCKKFSKLKKSRLKVFLFFPQGPIETYIHAIQYTSRQDEVYVPHNFGSRAFLGNRKAKETVYKKKVCKKGGEKRIKMSRKLFFFNSQLPSKLSNPIWLYVTSYIKTNMFLFNRKIENSKKMSIENKEI